MTQVFWLNLAALFLTSVVGFALFLTVLGAGLKKMLNLTFAIFALTVALSAVANILRHLSLWLDMGNPLLLSEFNYLGGLLFGPLILMFSALYLNRRNRWTDWGVGIGLVIIGLACIPLFSHQFITDLYLDEYGIARSTTNSWRIATALLPAVFTVWALVLFWLERHRVSNNYMIIGLVIFLGGYIINGALHPIFPVISVTTAISIAVLGYGVAHQQIFNPLKELTDELQQLNTELDQRVQKRTSELAQANTEIQTLNDQLKSENVRMATELDVTRRLQQMLLPSDKELQQVEGVDIAGFMEPADEVGGDYYDVLQHNGQIKIGIGDVTGHGLESGVLMLMVQTAVRTLMTNDEKDPIRFLSVLNRTLHNNLQRMAVDKSLTLMLLDYETGQMRVSGQHEQLIVVRQGGRVELKDTLELGFPLGLVDEIGESVSELSIDLQPGDGVVLYSDGFTEAENEAQEFYGLERLCAVISRYWSQSAEEIKQAVVSDVRQFIGAQQMYDDLTLLVMKQK